MKFRYREALTPDHLMKSLEPTKKRREDSGEHNVHTHFPEDRSCEICKQPKITRVPCRRRNGEAVLRADKFWWFDNSRPQSRQRQLRVSKQSSSRSRGAGSSHSMDPGVFLEPERKPKVIYTDNSLKFGKAGEDLCWNHRTSTPHRSETNGIAERAVRMVKERTFAFLLQVRSGQRMVGGFYGMLWKLVGRFYGMLHLFAKRHRPIVWWEDALWKTFWATIWRTYFPFGSLVEYHPIIAKDQSRIHQFERKFYLDCSSDTLFTRGEIGTVTYWSQTLRSWRRWTHRKSTRKDSMRKRWHFRK